MPVPEQVPICHYRGDTLTMVVKVWSDVEKTIPVDLSFAVVTAQVRDLPNSTTVVATFECTVAGTGNNEIHLLLPPDQSALLPATCVYDIQLDWNGDGTSIQTIIRGPLDVPRDVTRPVA